MSTNTTTMAMGKAVDGDNAKTYLETTLGAALDKLDAHTHGGGTLGTGFTTATNVQVGDVALNNVTLYFDGPSMAQGTSGTWFVSGTVTCSDTVAAQFRAKLWDGTTVISSAQAVSQGAGSCVAITLSGYIATPAANIRISVSDTTSVNGGIRSNNTGLLKDSAIWGIRIG